MPNSEQRQQLRSARRALSQDAQLAAAQQLCDKVSDLPQWNTAQTVSAYLAFDGEISTHFLHQLAWQQHKTILLPLLESSAQNQLIFVEYDTHTCMQVNKFGIEEPVLEKAKQVHLGQIDIMLVPLVGFDSEANRMGMGGGYYDRTLGQIYQSETRPLLIGVAHHCQEVAKLTPAQWDIPMDYIVTDTKVISRT